MTPDRHADRRQVTTPAHPPAVPCRRGAGAALTPLITRTVAALPTCVRGSTWRHETHQTAPAAARRRHRRPPGAWPAASGAGALRGGRRQVVSGGGAASGGGAGTPREARRWSRVALASGRPVRPGRVAAAAARQRGVGTVRHRDVVASAGAAAACFWRPDPPVSSAVVGRWWSAASWRQARAWGTGISLAPLDAAVRAAWDAGRRLELRERRHPAGSRPARRLVGRWWWLHSWSAGWRCCRDGLVRCPAQPTLVGCSPRWSRCCWRSSSPPSPPDLASNGRSPPASDRSSVTLGGRPWSRDQLGERPHGLRSPVRHTSTRPAASECREASRSSWENSRAARLQPLPS